MSLLVVGLSHRTASLDLLERATLDREAAASLAEDLCRRRAVTEAAVLVTCNRLEVYVEAAGFHGGVADVSAALTAALGLRLDELGDHLYVHWAESAVAHVFSVACGMDSMALGESQILGQLRETLARAQRQGTAGPAIERLLQQALRVGKRAHSDTGLDRVAQSFTAQAFEAAGSELGPLGSLGLVVVGAGSMSGLVVAEAARAGFGSVTVLNRTEDRARRLAQGVHGSWSVLSEENLVAAVAAADVVVSCTGALGTVLPAALVARAQTLRPGARRVFVDLALPRDIEPGVAGLPGVRLIDLAELGGRFARTDPGAELEGVRSLLDEEVRGFLGEQRTESVVPAIVALRDQARQIAAAELARLDHRLDRLVAELPVESAAAVREEAHRAVHRVMDKLLHRPTVRAKQLAARSGDLEGPDLADALRLLFGLDDAGTPSAGPAATPITELSRP